MATVTHAIATASTTNATSYASGSFTPAASDLLVVFVVASGTTATGTMTDSQSLGWARIGSVLKNTSADTLYCFVARNFTTATSMTVTFGSSTTATGAIIEVARISGMSIQAGMAVLQFAVQANAAAAGTPAVTFNGSAQVTNPTLGLVGNSSSPAGLTPPTNWTEQNDTGYSTPTTGAEYVSRDNGFAGSTITWGGTSATAFGTIIIELDARPFSLKFAEEFDGTSVNLTAKTPDIGNSWSAVWTDTGSDQLITNGSGEGAASGLAGGGFIYTANINAAGAANDNADTYQRLKITSNPDSTHPLYFVARYVDTSNFYIMGFFGTFIRLYKCVAGTMSQVGSDTTFSTQVNDVIALDIGGSTLTAYVNSVVKATFVDASLTSAGRCGIAAGDVTNRVDNTFSAGTWRCDSYFVTYGSLIPKNKLYRVSQAINRSATF